MFTTLKVPTIGNNVAHGCAGIRQGPIRKSLGVSYYCVPSKASVNEGVQKAKQYIAGFWQCHVLRKSFSDLDRNICLGSWQQYMWGMSLNTDWILGWASVVKCYLIFPIYSASVIMHDTLYLIFVQLGYILIRSNIRIALYITIVSFVISESEWGTS